MMGHPDAGSFVSRRYLQQIATLWFSVGLTVGGVVSFLVTSLWR